MTGITHSASMGLVYTPGLLSQDLWTIPLEGLAVATVTSVLPYRKTPLWPFNGEQNTAKRLPSKHTSRELIPLAGAMSLPLFGGFLYAEDNFPLWVYARGWAHAHLLTELATISAKKTWGRHRPFYDSSVALGRVRRDDHFSFWSGHSTHAFAASVYLSAVARHHFTSPVAGWGLTAAYAGIATWIGATRAIDKQHHWSDVVAGAAAGTLISSFVASRTIDTATALQAGENAVQETSSAPLLEPLITEDAIGLSLAVRF